MNLERSSEPPEEPYTRSEAALLSPASPKPLHFPTPTNIPILEMQNDVDFNQTEVHMGDPAMRNTDVRPDIWRDPTEQDGEDASPYSTGGEAADSAQQEAMAADSQLFQDQQAADSTDNATNGAEDPEPVQLSNEASHQANANIEVPSAPEATTSDAPQASSDTSVEFTITGGEQGHVAQAEQAQPSVAPAFGSNVDVQALLDTLQPTPVATANGVNPVPPLHAQPFTPGLDASPSSASAAALGAPPTTGLPPRPPPQEQPLIHPNYVHSQHIRDYHPHAAHSAFHPQQSPQQNGAQGNVADPSTQSYVPPPVQSNAPASIATPQQAHPQTFAYSPTSATTQQVPGQSAIQTPVSALSGYNLGYQQGMPAGTSFTATGTPIESRRETKLAAGEIPTAEERPWDAETQAKYDRFIETERHYVSEGRWEQFPMGSRLFVGTRNLDGSKTRKDEVTLVDDTGSSADGLVGNLSSEKVTKRDIFHVFWRYGELAQISIKQAYGFVQFLSADECKRALDAEQGKQIRDKRIHLEISKPQKNRNPNQNQNQNQHQVRRSRSPDYGRGGKPTPGTDRYVSGRQQGRAGAGYGGQGFRSPSPSRGGYRERPNDRYRERSPDYGRRSGGGGRFRSPSPQRNEDDDLPLPKRAPRDVPDVQIIVLDSLERDFITWVEKAFSARGVRVDVLLLSPRLSEQAVVKRQIVEDVSAVVKLTRANQQTGKIGLQVFDRSAGQGLGSVKFEEYDGLDPPICAELVLRAKQNSAPPAPAPAPAYGGQYRGQQSYGAPPPTQQQYPGAYAQQQPPYGQQPPAPQGYPPQGYPPQQQQQPPPQNLQNLITSLDPNGLQSLLSAMGPQHSPATPQTGAYGTPQSAGAYGAPQHSQQQQAAMAALQQNPQIAAGLQQAMPHAAAQQGGGGVGGQVNMQDILAKLGRYKQ